MRFNKTLTALATAAALVAGVAIAQTDPVQPAPNTTGQPGNALGNTTDGTMSSGTMNNTAPTTGSTVDSSAPATSSDMAAPEPRADRN